MNAYVRKLPLRRSWNRSTSWSALPRYRESKACFLSWLPILRRGPFSSNSARALLGLEVDRSVDANRPFVMPELLGKPREDNSGCLRGGVDWCEADIVDEKRWLGADAANLEEGSSRV